MFSATMRTTAPADPSPVAAALRDVQRAFGKSGLESLPPNVLERALDEIDRMGSPTPAMGMLRLRLTRLIAANDAREQASRVDKPMRWQPLFGSRRRVKPDGSTLGIDSTFEDTVPLTPAPDKKAS